MHHPWRAFRRLGDSWKLTWAHLPGDQMGHTCFQTQTVTIDSRINQHERRCTIAHETEHIHRGPFLEEHREREEAIIHRIVSRRLIKFHHLADAMTVAYHERELAHALWVDVPTLRHRLDGLTDVERDALDQRHRDALLTFPMEAV